MNTDHPLLTGQRLEELLAAFADRSIGLIGDLFLDRYLMIEPGVREMSIETGLEAYQVTQVRNSPGALGTVINNLKALGVGRLAPLAVIGDDGHGDDLIRRLRALDVDDSHLVRSATRLTPTYTKPMRQGDDGVWLELNRLDFRDRKPLTAEDQQQLLDHLDAIFAEVDGWIVLDQIVEPNWGVINSQVRGRLGELAELHSDRLMFIDSRRHLRSFDFGVVKCNRDELLQDLGEDSAPAELNVVVEQAVRLARRTGNVAFCTLGVDGMIAAEPDGETQRIPGVAVSGPTDIVGAGDAATSAIVATLLSGGSPVEAAQLGNLTASITVQKIGETGTSSPDELRAAANAK